MPSLGSYWYYRSPHTKGKFQIGYLIKANYISWTAGPFQHPGITQITMAGMRQRCTQIFTSRPSGEPMSSLRSCWSRCTPPLSPGSEGAPCNLYPGSQLPDGRPVLQSGPKASHFESPTFHAGSIHSYSEAWKGGSLCRGQADWVCTVRMEIERVLSRDNWLLWVSIIWIGTSLKLLARVTWWNDQCYISRQKDVLALDHELLNVCQCRSRIVAWVSQAACRWLRGERAWWCRRTASPWSSRPPPAGGRDRNSFWKLIGGNF